MVDKVKFAYTYSPCAEANMRAMLGVSDLFVNLVVNLSYTSSIKAYLM